MVDYEREILALKDTNEVMKLKTMTATQKASTVGALPAATGTEGKITELQALVQKRDQELLKQKDA